MLCDRKRFEGVKGYFISELSLQFGNNGEAYVINMLLKLQSESDRTETAGKKPKEEMKECRPNKGRSRMMCRKIYVRSARCIFVTL